LNKRATEQLIELERETCDTESMGSIYTEMVPVKGPP